MSGTKMTAMLALLGLPAATVVAVPAQADQVWSEPEKVSTRYGRQLSLSDDGRTAVWIQVRTSSGPGPLYFSAYRGWERGWSVRKPIAGSAETQEAVLSADGATVLLKGETAYSVISRRSRHRWTAPSIIADSSGSLGGIPLLQGGSISADGRTAVWIDGSAAAQPPVLTRPIVLRARTRSPGGTWGPAQDVGQYRTSFASVLNPRGRTLALSSDGSTVAWLNNDSQIVGARRAGEGTWTTPVVIQAYQGDPDLRDLSLSGDGSRVVWQSGGTGVLTATRTAAGWSDPTYVMQNQVSAVAMSPDGKVVAYGQRDPDRIRVRRYRAGGWTSPRTLGAASSPTITARDRAVAWVADNESGGPLRVSLLRRGKWLAAPKIAPKALELALSRKADTVAWTGLGAERIFSVHR